MNVIELESAATNAKPKPCPICDAPAVVVWTSGYLGCVIMCVDIACRCKVDRQAVNCGPMRILRDALAAWNDRRPVHTAEKTAAQNQQKHLNS